VVEAQRDEGKDGPPKSDYFGSQIATLHAKETRQTHKPVTSDSFEEDLIKCWDSLLLVHELLDGCAEGIRVEDATIYGGKVSVEVTEGVKRTDIQTQSP